MKNVTYRSSAIWKKQSRAVLRVRGAGRRNCLPNNICIKTENIKKHIWYIVLSRLMDLGWA